jgi:hypothetical protein
MNSGKFIDNEVISITEAVKHQIKREVDQAAFTLYFGLDLGLDLGLKLGFPSINTGYLAYILAAIHFIFFFVFFRESDMYVYS